MRTKAAIIREPGKPWDLTELELDEPRRGEVRIRFAASGMCHSDEHLCTGDATGRLPLVGGHEGAGVVEAVGDGVSRVSAGDHVVCSFIPACGVCRYYSTGRQNLCDQGAQMVTGMLSDGGSRFHDDEGADLGGFCMLGTFAERAVVSQASCVKIDDDIPFDVAALTGCGVPPTAPWSAISGVSRATCSACATRCTTSRSCCACTGAASSSWTSSSPAATRWPRSTPATRTSPTARSSAA